MAEFFEHGKNRLVMPGIAARADEKPKGEEEKVEEKGRDGSSGGGGSEGLCLDPLLVALLKKIPATGNDWPAGQRVRWFKTFAMNVSQIYDGDGEPVEMKIELEAPAS